MLFLNNQKLSKIYFEIYKKKNYKQLGNNQ